MVTVQHFYKLSCVHICSFRCLSLLLFFTVSGRHCYLYHFIIDSFAWPLLDRCLTNTWPLLDQYLTTGWPLVVLGGHCSLSLQYLSLFIDYSRWLSRGLLYHRYLCRTSLCTRLRVSIRPFPPLFIFPDWLFNSQSTCIYRHLVLALWIHAGCVFIIVFS